MTAPEQTGGGRGFVRAAYVLTFLTGVAGLVDQVVWQRYMVRLLGSDGLATATVLGVFLGGLSLGFVVCGRLTTRVRRVFLAYGVLEGVIGLWAFTFPWLYAAVDAITNGWSFAAPAGLILQGTLCTILLLGPPTICMGGTVPMLTRGLTATVEGSTAVHARVYAINTLGAAAGTLLAGFVLIQAIGLPASLRFAGALNLIAAAFFAIRGRTIHAPAAPATPASKDGKPERKKKHAPASPGPSTAALHGIAFLSGFAFITLETLLVRITRLSLGPSSYSFSIVVAAFILAIAIGAWLVARRTRIGSGALLTNHVWICVSLALLFVTLDLWPYAAHRLRIGVADPNAGFATFWTTATLAVFVATVIPVACMGATLPLAFHALRKELTTVGQRAGTLLAWNALGNLLGGLGGGYVVLYWLGIGEAYVLVLVSCGIAALLASSGVRPRRRAAFALAAVVGVAVMFPYDATRMAVGTFRLRDAVEFSYDGPTTFYREFFKTRELLAYRDAPEGSFAVTQNLGMAQMLVTRFPLLAAELADETGRLPDEGPPPRSILVNGKPDSSTFYDRETLRLLAHLPALIAPRLDRVLIVGLGTGVTAGEFALHPEVRELHVAEISATVADFLPLFAEATGSVETDPRLRLHTSDAFRLLRRNDDRWDVIVSEPSNPWVTGVDQVFSREFYRLVGERLTDDGIFVQWLQRYATTPEIRAIVFDTLRDEFPAVRLFETREGLDDLIVATRRPLDDDTLARIDQRIARNQRVQASLLEIDVDGGADLLARERPVPATDGDGPRETLDRPRLHFLSTAAHFRGQSVE